MFWRLGFLNAWRNLSRSILAFISIAMATGFMTRVLFVQGYTSALDEGFRSMIEGDISVYSLKLNADGLSAERGWQYHQHLTGIEDTDLNLMMPELLSGGYIADSEPRVPFSSGVIAALKRSPYVHAVSPRYQMPATSHTSVGAWSTPLRGRNLDLEDVNPNPISKYVNDGRWFTKTDQGELVAVVHSAQHYPPGVRKTGVGDVLKVSVPCISQREGQTYYDYANPLLVELRVIGVLDVPLRAGTQFDPSGVWIHQLYAQNDEIQLPLETWKRIWKEAGGTEYRPQQLALMINDRSALENVVHSLRKDFPQFSFFSASSLLRRTEANFLLETYDKVMFYDLFAIQLMHATEDAQAVQTNDLRLPLAILMFTNAALIIASNLLIMISERRKEIGIFKAVGARRVEIMQMILAEALLISLLGCLCGFAVARFSGVLTQLTNHLPWTDIVGDLLCELFQVLGIASIATLLFGLIPALMTANLPVHEVLQEE